MANRFPTLRVLRERTLPPGTGFVLVGFTSVLLWGIIAGVATLF